MARESERPKLQWEKLNSKGGGVFNWDVYRTKVPGGWLVQTLSNTSGLTYYPDPQHRWDGASLD